MSRKNVALKVVSANEDTHGVFEMTSDASLKIARVRALLFMIRDVAWERFNESEDLASIHEVSDVAVEELDKLYAQLGEIETAMMRSRPGGPDEWKKASEKSALARSPEGRRRRPARWFR